LEGNFGNGLAPRGKIFGNGGPFGLKGEGPKLFFSQPGKSLGRRVKTPPIYRNVKKVL